MLRPYSNALPEFRFAYIALPREGWRLRTIARRILRQSVWPCGESATVVFGSLFLTRPCLFNWRIIRFEFAGTGLSQEIISGRRLLLRAVCLLFGFFPFVLSEFQIMQYAWSSRMETLKRRGCCPARTRSQSKVGARYPLQTPYYLKAKLSRRATPQQATPGIGTMTDFPLETLQAISDWQRGGSAKQKKQRGERLKQAAETLDPKFRTCGLSVFRQIALPKGGLWHLLADNRLPESISAWTTDLAAAKQFKGGVPPKGQGYQGAIFVLRPGVTAVVVNLSSLFADKRFMDAVARHKHEINGFGNGIGRYGARQSEVVVELDALDVAQVFAFGGYSSERHELAALMLKRQATPEELVLFDLAAVRAGANIGPDWIEGESLERVVKRMQPHIKELREIKRLQDEAKKPRRRPDYARR